MPKFLGHPLLLFALTTPIVFGPGWQFFVNSLGAAVVFAFAAAGAGPVARYGGAVWVFILTWIILMPVLAPWLKERRQS